MANVTIHSLNSMSFTVTATDTVTFILGGFSPGTKYAINVDGDEWSTVTADSYGRLQFEYSSWSGHDFDISLYFASTTKNITINVIPVLLSIFLIALLFALLYADAFTVESLVAYVIIVIIVVATITIIT